MAFLWTAYLLVQWITLSSILILLNKHLLSSAGFDLPVTLVLMHMCFASLCSAIWRWCGWISVPKLTYVEYLVRFAPVGLCFAVSLSLGNAAYLYISVAFVQMLKASTPVATLVFSFCFGLERPSCRLFAYILLVSCGIFVSCVSQVHPSVPGVVLQLSAIGAEAVRLCLVNILLTSRGLKLSPIASLYLIAPICAACLLPLWALFEAPRLAHRGLDAFRVVGPLVFAANLSLAFVLNLATMALIKHTSALTLNVAGVVKDLLLIGYSVAVSGARVGPMQFSGYAVAFVGVTAYSNHKRSLQAKAQALDAKAERILDGEDAQAMRQPLVSSHELDVDDDDDDGDDDDEGGTTLRMKPKSQSHDRLPGPAEMDQVLYDRRAAVRSPADRPLPPTPQRV